MVEFQKMGEWLRSMIVLGIWIYLTYSPIVPVILVTSDAKEQVLAEAFA